MGGGGGSFGLFNDVAAAQVTACILSFCPTVQHSQIHIAAIHYLRIGHASG